MTDRVAALAEALQVACYRNEWHITTPPEGPVRSFDDFAAAILAALPPDWCGHDPGLFPFASRFAALEAEIARLRGLALRLSVRAHKHHADYPISECVEPLCIEAAALRAALEEQSDR